MCNCIVPLLAVALDLPLIKHTAEREERWRRSSITNKRNPLSLTHTHTPQCVHFLPTSPLCVNLYIFFISIFLKPVRTWPIYKLEPSSMRRRLRAENWEIRLRVALLIKTLSRFHQIRNQVSEVRTVPFWRRKKQIEPAAMELSLEIGLDAINSMFLHLYKQHMSGLLAS